VKPELCLHFLTAAVALAVPYFFHRSAEEPRALRFVILPPEKNRINESLALSPDGQRLAFVATDLTGKNLLQKSTKSFDAVIPSNTLFGVPVPWQLTMRMP